MGTKKKLSKKKIDRFTRRLEKKLRLEKLSYKDIENTLDVKPGTARHIISNLRRGRYELQEEIFDKRKYFYMPVSPMRENLTKTYSLDKSGSGWRKFGLISDTHFNSKYEADHELQCIYDDFEDEAIEHVTHGGDVSDGNGRMYRGQLSEINRYGYQNILDDVVRRYPKRKGIYTTSMTSGNHDMSFYKSEGIKFVKDLANRRSDIDYLGQLSAILDFDGVTAHIVHADGGMPYARSYKIQKMIEQMSEKPDMLLRGHLHVSMYLPYLGVHSFEGGCFQKQTPYLARKGLRPEVGGWIISYKTDKFDKLEKIRPEWLDYGSKGRARSH